jgi:hypothetical protein
MVSILALALVKDVTIPLKTIISQGLDNSICSTGLFAGFVEVFNA